MTTKDLLYVKTVADEHNISKAAKKLFMAQPSLSQSIQRIEESIGMPLFHRTTTGLTLTFAGERYYHMAVQVLKMYEDFQLEISDINNLKTGHIHIDRINALNFWAPCTSWPSCPQNTSPLPSCRDYPPRRKHRCSGAAASGRKT